MVTQAEKVIDTVTTALRCDTLTRGRQKKGGQKTTGRKERVPEGGGGGEH